MNDPIADPPVPEDLRAKLEGIMTRNGFARARVFWGPEPEPREQDPQAERKLYVEGRTSCCDIGAMSAASPELLRAFDPSGTLEGSIAAGVRRQLKRACTTQDKAGCAARRFRRPEFRS